MDNSQVSGLLDPLQVTELWALRAETRLEGEEKISVFNIEFEELMGLLGVDTKW